MVAHIPHTQYINLQPNPNEEISLCNHIDIKCQASTYAFVRAHVSALTLY